MFGLQDKNGALVPGQSAPDGTLIFRCELTVKDSDTPVFTGMFAHGTPQDRFLYLSCRHVDPSQGWVRRIKIPLNGITPAQAEQAQNSALETTVDGRQAARVAVDWRVV